MEIICGRWLFVLECEDVIRTCLEGTIKEYDAPDVYEQAVRILKRRPMPHVTLVEKISSSNYGLGIGPILLAGSYEHPDDIEIAVGYMADRLEAGTSCEEARYEMAGIIAHELRHWLHTCIPLLGKYRRTGWRSRKILRFLPLLAFIIIYVPFVSTAVFTVGYAEHFLIEVLFLTIIVLGTAAWTIMKMLSLQEVKTLFGQIYCFLDHKFSPDELDCKAFTRSSLKTVFPVVITISEAVSPPSD